MDRPIRVRSFLMTNPAVDETIARWKALEPSTRRRLLIHLSKLLAMFAAAYVIEGLIFQSWWWPAVATALSMLTSSLVQRFRRRPRG
jgi:hypothetical protein